MVGRDEVRDGGVEAAGEVVGEAGGESPPRGESHGGGGGEIARLWEGRRPEGVGSKSSERGEMGEKRGLKQTNYLAGPTCQGHHLGPTQHAGRRT